MTPGLIPTASPGAVRTANTVLVTGMVPAIASVRATGLGLAPTPASARASGAAAALVAAGAPAAAISAPPSSCS